MKKLLVISLFLVGCTSNIPITNVDYSFLLNDHNSKVWLIKRQIVNNINISNGHNWNKDLMIFHVSGKVEIIPMKALGKTRPKKGHYLLRSDEKLLEISFPEEEWLMDLSYITEDSIFMSPAKGSEVDYSIQIIPFPELD